MKNVLILTFCFLQLAIASISSYSQSKDVTREHILLDSGWQFALGHSFDKNIDFGNGKGSFSYYAKTGYGDGAASEKFDDRAWRKLNLPHDWAIELPFSPKGSSSHGYKAMGEEFPENNVGWYRKNFFIPAEDKDKRVNIEFEGIFRDAKIWINGFYIGEEQCGYSSYQYDISAYLKYGGNNVIAVRVDAGMEEGWFYEGAGIYRHVWLTKTPMLHIAYNGTFISSQIKNNQAVVTTRTTVVNDGTQLVSFAITQNLLDASRRLITTNTSTNYTLAPGELKEFRAAIKIDRPTLWSLENPHLYSATTQLKVAGKETDSDHTTFGIRSIRFSADSGFFLNGKHIFLKGTNNHQDFSGVGVAVPDGLQEYRIEVLKSMGCNAIRCSHNPPNIAFLDACDRLGVLVLDENRLMGTSPEHYQQISRMVLRDRNHPCIIAWSIGNEEWAIEGNGTGAKIAAEMQAYVQRLDSTRRVTAAVSGGRVQGISTTIDMMGYNYSEFGDIDEHHKKFPLQPMMLTEERTAFATRGVYVTDSAQAHMIPTDRSTKSQFNLEPGLQFCNKRPFLAGIFFWTGFDYHGEPVPFNWPQIDSQCGIVDLCGFPKDQFYFAKCSWINIPQVHISTHWNWPGKDGKNIYTKIYSNCEEVELYLNGRSLGRKPIPYLSSAVWEVPYRAGVLMAKGYKNGKAIITDKVETTGAATTLTAEKHIYANKITGSKSAVVNVQVKDNSNRVVPLAMHALSFEISGPAKIIGVGNGDPSSHDPETFTETIQTAKITDAKMAFTINQDDGVKNIDAYTWHHFQQTEIVNKPTSDTLIMVKADFSLSTLNKKNEYTFFAKNIASHQSVYLNGKFIGKNEGGDESLNYYKLEQSSLKTGNNTLLIIGKPFIRKNSWESISTDLGIIQEYTSTPAWQRKAFNGLAQVLLQLENKPGKIILKITADGLKPVVLDLGNE